MTITEPRPADPADIPGADGRSWAASIWAHLGLLAVVLVGFAAMAAPRGTFVADDGSYQLQLRALDRGSWNWESGTEALDPDPEASHYPVVNGEPTTDGIAPSAKHPAWPWLAHQVSPVTSTPRAYLALSFIGILGLAALAWKMAADHDPSLSPWAFWLAGTAPVAITVGVPWAHAAATALAALATFGALRTVERGATVARAALVAVGIVGCTLLRTEGLLFAGAIGVALVVGGRRAGRSWTWAGLTGSAAVGLGLLAVKVEEMWIRSITLGGSLTLKPRDGGGVAASNFLEARFSGATRSLFDTARPAMTFLLAAAVVASAVTAYFAAQGRPRLFTYWVATSSTAVVLLLLRVLWLPNLPVSGLLATWPIVVAGLAAALPVVWRRLPVELTVVLVYGVLVGATQYADGGAGSWGGRFFALMTAPLVVIAALGLRRLLDAAPAASADSLFSPRRYLVGLLVVPALLGAGSVYSVESTTASLYDFISERVDGLAVTPAAELPRFMWREDEQWLIVDDADAGDDLADVLDHLAVEGPTEVQVVFLDEDAAEVAGVVEAQQAWRETDSGAYGGLTVVDLER